MTHIVIVGCTTTFRLYLTLKSDQGTFIPIGAQRGSPFPPEF